MVGCGEDACRKGSQVGDRQPDFEDDTCERELCISESAVEKHSNSIMMKLQLDPDNASLNRKGRRSGGLPAQRAMDSPIMCI